MKWTDKVIVSIAASLVLLPAGAWLSWQIRHAYYEPRKLEAMQFCEALIPALESARQRDGHYPAAIDPQWIQGKDVPALIRISDFYLPDSGGYLLRFRNPGDFYDDIWGYDGTPGGGSWSNYDGY